jgi:hypothetical protein
MRNGPPEVVDEGVTGFIVRNVEEAAAAVERLGELDRARVRATFEKRFTVGRMAEDYLAIYRALPDVRTEAAWLRRRNGAASVVRAADRRTSPPYACGTNFSPSGRRHITVTP